MALSAGRLSTLKIPGTSTALVNEPCTDLGAHTVYRITDATKRVLNPAVTAVVDVGGVVAAPSTFTLDLLDGRITFLVAQSPVSAVRVVSGAFLPMLTVLTAKNCDIDIGYEAGDATVYGDTAKRQVPLIKKLSGSYEVVEDLLTDHDSGAGSVTLSGLLETDAETLVEFWPGGVGNKLRAWVHISGKQKTEETGLVGATISFEASTQYDPIGRRTVFSWCSPT